VKSRDNQPSKNHNPTKNGIKTSHIKPAITTRLRRVEGFSSYRIVNQRRAPYGQMHPGVVARNQPGHTRPYRLQRVGLGPDDM
jgi:hypothetical protein